MTKCFMSQQRVDQGKYFPIATEHLYVATKMAKVRRNYVATETICIATELVKTENYAAHNKARVRELGAQRHALGLHSTKTRETEEFCRDREFSVTTDFTQLFGSDRLLTTMLL